MCNRQTSFPSVVMIANKVTDNHQSVEIKTCGCVQMHQLILAESEAIKAAISLNNELLQEVMRKNISITSEI